MPIRELRQAFFKVKRPAPGEPGRAVRRSESRFAGDSGRRFGNRDFLKHSSCRTGPGHGTVLGRRDPVPGKQAVHDFRDAPTVDAQIPQSPTGRSTKFPNGDLPRTLLGNPAKEARHPSAILPLHFHFDDLL
jgi:hypothetical protein